MLKKIVNLQLVGNLIALAFIAFIYTQITAQILLTPIDFDEGYNLQISQHLNNNFFNYSTFTAKFDPNVTTGPALLIPASLIISQTYPLLPRIIMLIFAIFFIYFCHVYMYTGRLQRIIFLILISITPLFYYFSSHILGELPGFVFFLISLIALNKKRYSLSGALLGLSILTKQIYMFGFLSIILEFTLIHIFSKKQRVTLTKNIALVTSGFILVFLIWYSYILVSVNFSYANFQKVLSDYYTTTQTLSQPKISLIDKRLEMFYYVFGINGIIFAIIVFYISWQSLKNLRQNHIAISLAFFIFIYTIYYIFLGSTNWYRHFFPAILALIVLVPIYLEYFFSSLTRQKMILMFVVLLVVSLNISYNLAFNRNKNDKFKLIEQNLIFLNDGVLPPIKVNSLLSSQLQTARFIRNEVGKDKIISGISWWNAPEIEYLANRKIARDPFQKNTDYLITHYYGDLLGPTDYQYLNLVKNKKEIYKSEGYKIFRMQ